MAAKIFMNHSVTQKIDLNDLIAMIGSIAALDFSKRLEVELDEDPATVIAFGLNMLSEELEENVVKRSSLEEVNKNLEQFAYILAHDIKSPLSIALGLLSIIEPELDIEKNEVLKEYFPPLKKSLTRINSMIIGILEYSRTSFDKVKISELDIQKICEEIGQLYPAERKPEMRISTGIPSISFNEIAMRQILQNLIGNAVKYNDKPVCRIDITCNELPDFYEISVQDNGPGISECDLALVFELFENLRSKDTQSHGVGLAIVRKLIEQAGGTIRVDSVLQSGTTFSFTISKGFVQSNNLVEQVIVH
jgi:signal transduction histidine kinase